MIPWSEEEMDIVRRMAEKGCGATDMSRVLKSRSVAAINNKLTAMGLILGEFRKPKIDYDALRLFDA
jgi:hypothetical protein